MFNSTLRARSFICFFFYFPANIFFCLFCSFFFCLSVFSFCRPGHKTAFWPDAYNVPLNICQASHKWSTERRGLIELNLKLCCLKGTQDCHKWFTMAKRWADEHAKLFGHLYGNLSLATKRRMPQLWPKPAKKLAQWQRELSRLKSQLTMGESKYEFRCVGHSKWMRSGYNGCAEMYAMGGRGRGRPHEV